MSEERSGLNPTGQIQNQHNQYLGQDDILSTSRNISPEMYFSNFGFIFFVGIYLVVWSGKSWGGGIKRRKFLKKKKNFFGQRYRKSKKVSGERVFFWHGDWRRILKIHGWKLISFGQVYPTRHAWLFCARVNPLVYLHILTVKRDFQFVKSVSIINKVLRQKFKFTSLFENFFYGYLSGWVVFFRHFSEEKSSLAVNHNRI